MIEPQRLPMRALLRDHYRPGSTIGKTMAKKRTVKPFYTKAMQRAEQMARALMKAGKHREASAIFSGVREKLARRLA